jgi:hypothetical protein
LTTAFACFTNQHGHGSTRWRGRSPVLAPYSLPRLPDRLFGCCQRKAHFQHETTHSLVRLGYLSCHAPNGTAYVSQNDLSLRLTGDLDSRMVKHSKMVRLARRAVARSTM